MVFGGVYIYVLGKNVGNVGKPPATVLNAYGPNGLSRPMNFWESVGKRGKAWESF